MAKLRQEKGSPSCDTTNNSDKANAARCRNKSVALNSFHQMA